MQYIYNVKFYYEQQWKKISSNAILTFYNKVN